MYLFRYKHIKGVCTRGLLLVGGSVYHTLEPPWVNNERNKSCIPTGNYDYRYMERSSSGKYKGCYHIMNVPNRSEILIHNGNVPDHTLGCILIGQKPGRLAGKPAVLSSKMALHKLNDQAEKTGKLRVISWIG